MRTSVACTAQRPTTCTYTAVFFTIRFTNFFSLSSSDFFLCLSSLLRCFQYLAIRTSFPFKMKYNRRQSKTSWRSEKQKHDRSYNCRKGTLIKSLIAINKLPNTRFGLYGEHDGKWIKFEPDETFSRDIGVTVQAQEKFGPRHVESSLSQVSRQPLPRQTGYLINLTEDIFEDSPEPELIFGTASPMTPSMLLF